MRNLSLGVNCVYFVLSFKAAYIGSQVVQAYRDNSRRGVKFLQDVTMTSKFRNMKRFNECNQLQSYFMRRRGGHGPVIDLPSDWVNDILLA